MQRYMDYEVNEAVRRVMSFLFLVLGVVVTIALTSALCGMLDTLDWTLTNGVQRSNDAMWLCVGWVRQLGPLYTKLLLHVHDGRRRALPVPRPRHGEFGCGPTA